MDITEQVDPAVLANARRAMPPPTLVLKGDARARGRTYGDAMQKRIHRSLDSYRGMFETCGISWAQAQAMAAPYEAVIERTFPHLLDELRGLSEGSGVDFASLLALNSRTEILPPNYLAIASAGALDAYANECTAFAVSGSALLAQNWDWIGSQREALVLIEAHPDDGPAYLTVAEAGMLAKIGLNEHGLGVTLNILRSQRDGSQAGMPVHMLLRGLLDCRDLGEARELALGLAYAGSSNILMADAGGAVGSLEASPKGARMIEPDGDVLCHTNHFLHADLAPEEANLAGNLSTVERLSVARARIHEVSDMVSAAALLSDTSAGFDSVCRFPNPAMPAPAAIETVVGVIMDLRSRRMHVSGAQPCVSAFHAYTLH
ncbi:MAG: C45 family peptidase [Burkholderiaceae bacterium]